MTRRFCLFLLCGVAAAQIVTPRIGYIVDGKGNLREVTGVTGAFTIGPALEGEVVSVAYSGDALVVKKAAELRVDERTFEAPEGPAVVVFNDKGKVAEIFFPEAKISWSWRDGKFSAAPAHDVITDAFVREGELFVHNAPVRLSREAKVVSQLGEGWLVVYADDRMFAVRGSNVFELPEVGE